MSLDVGTLSGRIVLEDEMSAGLLSVSKSLAAFEGNLDKMGDKTTKLGRDLVPLSAALTAIGGASIYMASTFEASMTRLVSIAGVTSDEIDMVKASILKLSEDTGVGPQMLADAMTKISSTTDDTTKALEILNIAALGTKAGFGETVGVAGALTAVLNSYASTNLTAARAGDILAKAIQLGGAEASELAPTLANVVPQAAMLGISFEEVAANLATLTKLGVPTTEAVTQLSSVMTALSKETNQGTEALGRVGLSYEMLRKQAGTEGLQATLKTLNDAFKGNVVGLTDVFGRVEAVRNIMGTAGVQGETYADVLDQIKSSSEGATPALVSMADAMDETTVQNVAELKAKIEVLAIELGDELAPALAETLDAAGPLLDWVKDAIKGFAAMDDETKKMVIGIGAFGAVAAPALIILGGAMSATAAGFKLLGGAVEWVGWALGSLVGITGSIVVSIGALAVAWASFKNDWVRSFDVLIPPLGMLRTGIDAFHQWLGKPVPPEIKRDLPAALGEVNMSLKVAKTASTIYGDGLTEIAQVVIPTFTSSLSDANKAIDALTDAKKREIVAGDKLGKNHKEIAAAVGTTEEAVKLYLERLEDGAKVLKKNAEEQKKVEEWVKKTNDEWRAGSEASDKFMKDVTASTERITKAILGNYDKQKAADIEAAAIHREMTTNKYQFAMDSVDLWLQNELLTIDKSVAGWETTEAAMRRLAEAKKALLTKNETDSLGFVGPIQLDPKKWTEKIGEIGSAFSDMFEGVNDKAAQIFKVMGEGLEKMTAKGAEAGTKMAVGFGMAASVVSTVLGEEAGTKWGAAAVGALSGAAAGAAIGMMFTPIGAGVGAAIGSVVGAVGGWVSSTNKAIQAQKEATAEVQKLKSALVDQYGSLEELEALSTRLFGMSFVGEWGNEGAEGLKKMTEFTKDFEKRLASVTNAVNKMMEGFAASTSVLTAGTQEVGDALTKAQANYDSLKESGTATDAQLKEATDAVTQALERQYEVGQNSKQMLSDLGIQGVATFGAVYAATGSYTEALAAVGPTLTTLDQAYVALGLQVDNVLLSHLMLQAGVLESNPNLMAAIEGQAGAMQGMAQMGLLNADTFASMQRTGIELYQRLQAETALQAEATGDLGDHTVDALMPMQKYLQQATVQAELLGLPLDANTQRLIDQSKELGIWKEAGKSANDLLIEGIAALNQTMQDLANSIGSIGNGLRNIPSNITTDVLVRHHTEYSESVNNGNNAAGGGLVAPGAIHLAGGGGIWSPHGSDTVPAMLTPGERVLTVSQNNAYERDHQRSPAGDARMAGAIDRLTDAVLGQSDTLLMGLRDVLLERG